MPDAPPAVRYVYAVTRLDLPPAHRTVQVGHAILAATNTYGEPSHTHPHLIVCAVADESALTALFERLKAKGVRCCAFYEDDMCGALTAIATAPLTGGERRPLRRLFLLP
jgi:hypothetical protein